MLLTIHDAHLHPVASIDNDKQATLNYFSDTWTRYLDTGAAQFNFTAVKKALINDTYSKRTYNFLSEKNFISFEYEGEAHLFIVRKVIENEELVKVNCVNLNLELINEYVNAYKAPKAMSFEEYCKVFDLLNFTMLKIGINEVADKKITAEWEGQDTKLARLLSLVNKFGAEIEFKTTLNDDGSIKSFVINVYHENDENHQGVGKVRSKVLRYGRDFRSLTRTVDTTGIYNATRPTGKTEEGEVVTIAGMQALEIKNEKGEIEFFQRGDMLYAPLSMSMFPAAFTSDTMSDQWIRKDFPVESASKEVIRSSALRELKKNCYPAVTYEVDGFLPYNPGDTVEIEDDGFYPTLLLQMRVSEQSMSFTGTGENKTVFANFKAIENKLSSGIQKRLEEMLEEAKPYTIKLATNNGIIFKNNQGTSTVYPTLKKGQKPVECTWKWLVDNQGFGTSPTFEVKAAGMSSKLVLTAIALIDGKEVAREQVTFSNVNDGKNGSNGEKGEDGKSLRLFTTQYKYAQKFINQYSTDGYTGDWSVIESTAGLKVGDSVQMRVFNTDKESDSWIVAVASAVLGEHKIKTVSKGLIEKGDQGERGPKGATGEKGDKGDPGKPADPAPINQLKQDMELAKQGLNDVKSDLLREKSESSTKIEQVKQDVGAIRNQQTAYEQTNTQNLARITGQLGDKASKSEVKQTADGIREEISKISVGGKNLLKGSKGEFKPDINPSNFDNNVLYVQSTSIDLVKGEKYLISAKTDGVFSNNHNGTQESDNVVLWLMDKTVTNYQIVSDNNTGTTGTLFTWNKPTGTYHLRVNTYHKDARKKVWEVKVEQGTIKTDWSPAPEDTDEQITAARTTFEKTAEGLKTDLTAVKSYVANDGKRKEELEQYSREETARQIAAERIKTAENYVGKSQYTEDVEGVNRRFEELSIGGVNLIRGAKNMVLASGKWNTGTFRASGAGTAKSIDVTDSPVSGFNKGIRLTSNGEANTQIGVAQDEFDCPANTYTSSWWVKGKKGQKVRIQSYWWTGDNTGISPIMFLQDSNWTRITFTSKRSKNGKASIGYVYLMNGVKGDYLDVMAPQLEVGAFATANTEAPEDTETKLAEYKQTVDGQLAAVKQEVGSKVSQTTFDQRANQITQSVQELSNNTVKKNQIKIDENGLVSSSEKTVNGQTLASMISQNPEWVEIIAKLLKIKADMIVNGAITADKLNVEKLSALSSDLGKVNAGLIDLRKHWVRTSTNDVWGIIHDVTYDTSTLLSDSGVITNGRPGRNKKSDVKPTIMPLVWLNSGQLLFANVDSEHDIIQMLINGVYPYIRSNAARIYFGKLEDERDALVIDCEFSELYLKANNYTDWKQSTFNSGVRWKVQGSLVLVDFDLQFDRDGTYHLVDIPKEYVPSNKMFPVQAWSLDRNKDRTAQLNVGGDLHIIGAERGVPYLGQIIWTY